ncbi:MAG: hypothetical protein HYY30_06855 [Chloroflexi bacterium]|nr:hypothetical protein [Chloroflexota bacterium]
MDEYASAIEQAMAGQADLSRVSDILYEWQESARAMKHQPFLAELAISQDLVSEEEAKRLSAEDLRLRLNAAIAGNHGDR